MSVSPLLLPPVPPHFGLYIHWPFCLAKCPYCDFNSHVRHHPIDEPRFAAAFVRELETLALRIGSRKVDTIFFGGGTPSLMSADCVGRILDAVARLWPVADDVEITVEANPTSVEAAKFAAFKAAGVNRVSMGVQALDDAVLQTLGRQHSAAEALAAVEIAAAHFTRFSFDLITARPQQTPDSWRDELNLALRYAGGHMSIYHLTIEPQTPYDALYRAGKLVPLDAETSRVIFQDTQDILSHAGYHRYEVSNHAKVGHECRHNLLYWRYGEYVGIGPGAHGRLMIDGVRHATETRKNPEEWLNTVEKNGHGLLVEETLSRAEEADEFLLMGLRLDEGIDPKRFEAIAGFPLSAQQITSLVQEKMIEKTPLGRLRVTTEGILVLDAVVADLAMS